jgi:hypothetical protein
VQVSSSPADPRDQNCPSNNGSIALQSHPDDPLRLATSQFRSTSTEDATDVNGGGIASNVGTNLPPSRFGADSTFTARETSRRASTSDPQQGRPQFLSSPERRRHGPDSEYGISRHPPYMSDKERPPPQDMLSYDHERDWEKEHEVLERNRERERDQRRSLSDHRRFDFDRPSLNNDRLPPSFDRHSLPDDDRRPPHVEDKRPPSLVDRRSFDDRRIPNYERRPLLEENRSRNAPYRDLPQGSYLGNERRPDATQAAKTHVSVPLTSTSAPSPGPPVAINPVPDPTTDRVAASDRRPSGSLSAPMTAESQHVSTSCFVAPLEDHSNHVPSTSIAHPHQLMLRVEPTRLFSEERLSKPPENPGIDPAALPTMDQPLNDSSHTRVPKPLHIVDSRSVLNGDRERFSLTAADDRTPPLSTYSRAPSVGHDESRPHLPHPTPTPSTVSSAQSSLSYRAREPSRERPSNFRPYFRSEFNRPSEDDRRLDGHPLPPGDGIRRFDERGRWSPTHYGDRRGYRESHDRDRLYWASKDRTRDRQPQPSPHVPPSHWDRERGRYPELSYTGLHKRFVDRDQGNRERWSFDDSVRRPFETFAPRGRPRSPGSPNREFTELRPPPPKRARDDNYAGATGEAYYPRPHHPSSPSSSPNKDSLPPPLPSVPIPVPIPIPHPASPPRYNHNRPPPVELYGETYGGYERDGPRGPTGPGYSREGTR